MTNQLHVVHLSEAGQAERACPCMAEVPTPWPEALQASRNWIIQNVGTLVEGLHLEDDLGNTVGHVYYAFSEHALVPYLIEDRVAVLYCEWIQRRHQGKGYARLLFDALLRHLDEEGCKGVFVAATEDEQHMHYAHLTRRGFRLFQKAGTTRLMYHPLHQESINVQPVKVRVLSKQKHRVEVLVFTGGFCPYDVSTSLVALQVVKEFGHRVLLREVEATVENLSTYGAIGGVFVNGRQLPSAAPEEAVRRAIDEAIGGD